MKNLDGFYPSRRTVILNRIFSACCGIILLFLFCNGGGIVRNPLLTRPNSAGYNLKFSSNPGSFEVIRRINVEVDANSSNLVDGVDDNGVGLNTNDPSLCAGLLDHVGFANGCDFLKAHPQCSSGGLFDYLTFFYCDCSGSRLVGYLVLGIWLFALFYLLGNTAADYFCCSLEKLSGLLGLPPTVAGVVLLPLGNGAPDVFASIAAFLGTGSCGVGLNSILGGALFVTCIVVGTVSLCVANNDVKIDRKCFIRDVSFFLFTIACILLILVKGKISFLVAISFLFIYVVYAIVVSVTECLRKNAQILKLDAVTPLLPLTENFFSDSGQEDSSVFSALLEIDSGDEGSNVHSSLPLWMWASHVAIYSNQTHKLNLQGGQKPVWGWMDESFESDDSSFPWCKIFRFLEMPLTLPRRLTIPSVEEETWSKPFSVASAFFAPILLAFLWNTRDRVGTQSEEIVYLVGIGVGCTLAALAYRYTEVTEPPQRFLFPWVFGGFVMSIVWFYIIANELVSLLVGLGVILGINPSILGLTVLAWGNSMGDLTSNVALALNGGDGVQIAMSGSYAGPMFNTLAGLGISMVLGAWTERPKSYILPEDSSLFYTIGFLLSGIIWALVVLPRNDMRPSRILGLGLIIIYLIFLSVRLSSAVGVLTLA